MNNKKMKQFCFITTISLLLATNGCSIKSDKQILDNTNIDGKQATVSQTIEKDNTTNESTGEGSVLTKDNDSTSADTKETASETVERVATKEVSIYTINENTQGVESVVALVPEDSEITPRLIIDLVQDSLTDRSIVVGIDKITTEKDTVIVSFKSGQPPLINVSSDLEKTILDAIAQSLVDNLVDYPKVVFRVDGQAYSSANFSYGLNEVYLNNSKTK
ncbi:MAG: hypothetical protein WCD89_24015 [Anaerocolumna sp.]